MSLELTKSQIQEYLPVSNTFVPDNFKKYIRSAERSYMHKYLSKLEYEKVIAKDPNTDDVADQVIRATICLAYYKYIPFSAVILSNAGITQIRSETQVSAKQEAIEDLRLACYNEGFEELEAVLIAFEADPEIYTDWSGSDAATLSKQLLFRNATDFSRHVNIRELRRVFVTLMPSIRTLQNSRIRRILGNELLADLLITVSPENTLLIDTYVKPALAHLAMADAIPNLAVQLDEYDMILLSDNTGANRQSKSGKALDRTMLDLLVKSYQAKAETLLDYLCDFLLMQAADYPLYDPPTNIISDTVFLRGDERVIGF